MASDMIARALASQAMNSINSLSSSQPTNAITQTDLANNIILKSYSTPNPVNFDWRIILSNDHRFLISQRYQKNTTTLNYEWVDIEQKGFSVMTDSFIISQVDGNLCFQNTLGEKIDLIRPSSDGQGTNVGNMIGRFVVLSSGEGLFVKRISDSIVSFDVMPNKDIILNTTSNTYVYTPTVDFARTGGKFIIQNTPPVGTKYRVSVYNAVTNDLLYETCKALDFINDNGTLVVIGDNNYSLPNPRSIKGGTQIKVIFEFTNPVDLVGSNYLINGVSTFRAYWQVNGYVLLENNIATKEWAREELMDDPTAKMYRTDSNGNKLNIISIDSNDNILYGDNRNQVWLQTNGTIGVSYNGNVFSTNLSGTKSTTLTGTQFTISNFQPSKNIMWEKFTID